MAQQRPTLRQLEYFVALGDRLNFREAAESCFVTQPALSAQIAQLEATLGVQLFERDKRQVRLTGPGASLLPGARELLSRTDALCDLARSLGAPLEGPLRLGVIPTVGPYLLPRVLPSLRAAFPNLHLYLREEETSRLLAELDAGQLDLLLLAIDVDLGGLATLALFSDPFLLGVSERDELATREQVDLQDLAGRDVLLLEEGHCLREQTLPLCDLVGAEELTGFRATSLSTLTQMVVGESFVTLLPEICVERELAATPGLRAIPFGFDGPGRSIGLAWRQSSPRAEEFTALGQQLARAYAS